MSGIAGVVMFVMFLAGSAAAIAGAVLVIPPPTRTLFLAPAIGLWLLALVAYATVGVIAAILSTRKSEAAPVTPQEPAPPSPVAADTAR